MHTSTKSEETISRTSYVFIKDLYVLTSFQLVIWSLFCAISNTDFVLIQNLTFCVLSNNFLPEKFGFMLCWLEWVLHFYD